MHIYNYVFFLFLFRNLLCAMLCLSYIYFSSIYCQCIVLSVFIFSRLLGISCCKTVVIFFAYLRYRLFQLVYFFLFNHMDCIMKLVERQTPFVKFFNNHFQVLVNYVHHDHQMRIAILFGCSTLKKRSYLYQNRY